MKTIAIILCSLSLLAALPVSYLVYIMFRVFLTSHVRSDQRIGVAILALVPLMLGSGSIALWWVCKYEGWRFWVGLGGGLTVLVLCIAGFVLLPGGIEAAARP